MSKPKVSIIIPIKDRKYIGQMKEDLSKQTFRDFEYIVMDSKESVSVKRNKGVKQSRGDWIVFIDDDIRLNTRWLEELVKSARKDIPITGSVMTIYPFGFFSHSTTCNCIFHKSTFKPFDESFKYAAHEDKDWFFRMGGTEIVPSAVIYHMDQQKTNIKKNFIFGMEDVKIWMMYRGNKWDHSIKHSMFYAFRDSVVSISRAFGIIWGLVKYWVFRCK